MKAFIKTLVKFVVIIAIPSLLLLIPYLLYDPFKVLYQYDSFYEKGQQKEADVNAEYVAVETFLHNYQSLQYNSFIFGNSRSRFFEVADWSQYIGSDRCFHFDASNETLYG